VTSLLFLFHANEIDTIDTDLFDSRDAGAYLKKQTPMPNMAATAIAVQPATSAAIH